MKKRKYFVFIHFDFTEKEEFKKLNKRVSAFCKTYSIKSYWYLRNFRFPPFAEYLIFRLEIDWKIPAQTLFDLFKVRSISVSLVSPSKSVGYTKVKI